MGKWPRIEIACPSCGFENIHCKKSRFQVCKSCDWCFCVDCLGDWDYHSTGGMYHCKVAEFIHEREDFATKMCVRYWTRRLKAQYACFNYGKMLACLGAGVFIGLSLKFFP